MSGGAVVKQLALLAEPRPKRAKRSPLVQRDVKPDNVSLGWLGHPAATLEQPDRGITLAHYTRCVPNESGIGAEHLWCGVSVRVNEYHGTKPHTFQCDAYVELPDRRTTWSECRNFATRDGAAREAADFVVAAEGLLARWAAGERGIVPPGAKRWAAAVEAAKASQEGQALAVHLREAEEAEERLGEDAPWEAKRATSSLRHESRAAFDRFVDERALAFCRARDWREWT
jgi:hypothetical protein